MTFPHYNIETADVVGTGAQRAGAPRPILRHIHAAPGEGAIASSPWYVRRVHPGLSLTLPEASDTADINASNEAPQ
ncbi:hypothetical protein VSR34_20530 [Paraburkholderia sp. JHI2823]|uniref:hypothetical protein n=1 Tax=Paraburkholderia TaxID=1822464 RepID=UPI000429A6AF|nr:hypothetical protein [Paraburkholderia mimosarum]